MFTAFFAGGITGAVMTVVLAGCAFAALHGGWQRAAGVLAVDVAKCMKALIENADKDKE